MARKYQRGNLTLKSRANGPDCWEYRWRNASGKQKSKLLGTIEQYPTERDAHSAADAIRLEINAESTRVVPITVATLADRYLTDEIEMSRLAYATQLSYKSYLNNWVKPKWGIHTLEQVKAVAVEQWLRGLELAEKSKLHIRAVLHVLFECAARWGMVEHNPISKVRQGGARQTDPDVLTPDEFRALLTELTLPYREMVILAGCLGLARSEFSALKWADINWDAATLSIQRGIVHCHVGKTQDAGPEKTDTSRS